MFPEAMPSSVAVVDIGSNTIKVLIAARMPNGPLQALGMKTVDARISAGIGQEQPRLSEEGMRAGVAAVNDLLEFAGTYQPEETVIVATSAVRDAANRDEFCGRIERTTGVPIRLLSGEEEANLIGRGLTADLALAHLQDFYLFDLGGGSLECLAFRNRRLLHAQSFQLGCVRLTERFVQDPTGPLSTSASLAIAQHVRQEVVAGGFPFDVTTTAAIFAGGSMTATRGILAAEMGQPLESSSPRVSISELQHLLARIGPLTLNERKQVPGLPSARADVYPAALVTMIALAEIAGVSAFQHSFYNLRWGVADETLSGNSA